MDPAWSNTITDDANSGKTQPVLKSEVIFKLRVHVLLETKAHRSLSTLRPILPPTVGLFFHRNMHKNLGTITPVQLTDLRPPKNAEQTRSVHQKSWIKKVKLGNHQAVMVTLMVINNGY